MSSTALRQRKDSITSGGGSSIAGNGVSPASSSQSKPAAPSLEQSRAIARNHFEALRQWLARDDGLVSNASRSSAREKLTRLTRQQFAELSTDVYDELMRRQESSNRGTEQPYLSTRNDFHPKRNQARQKLATLPLQRFRDLASDVYYELERRYPEFGEAETVTDHAQQSSSNGGSNSNAPGHGLLASRSRDPTMSHVHSNSNSSNHSTRRSPPLPNSTSGSGHNRDNSNTPVNATATTTNDVVVPNKSTLVLEDGPSIPSGGGENTRSGRRTSESSFGGRLVGQYAASTVNTERRSWDAEEVARVKSDYEYKITVLSKRTAELEQENEDLQANLAIKSADTSRAARDLEGQVRSHRERYDEQTSTLDALRSDFEDLRLEHSRVVTSGKSTVRLQEELEAVTKERNDVEDLANDLKGECSSLVDELRSVNERYEELLQASEKEIDQRKRLEDEMRSWRKKYEGAKTELRNVRATSVLFLGSAIKVDFDHMPATVDGVIADVNVSSFQTSIDALLQAARSKEPSSVLPAMRVVVGVVDAIDHDIQSLADSRRVLPTSDQDRLAALKVKTHATLSNLMTASKNHAMSFGVSPVSLLDAAASHLSATVVDLIRLLKVRRTSGSTRDSLLAASSSSRMNKDGTLSPTGSNFAFNSSTAASSSRSPPSSDYRSDAAHPSLLSSSTTGMRSPPLTSTRERDYVSASTAATSNSDRYDTKERYIRSPPGSSYNNGDSQRSTSDDRYGSIANQRPPLASSGSAVSRIPSNASHRSRDGSSSGYQDNSSAMDRKGSYSQQGGRGTTGSVLTYGSPNLNQGEDGAESWDEIRTYLETQTEAIVHSIQSLLSAIRGGAQSDQLNENLTQIITIVSSIVAISKDALLSSTREEGEIILADLTDNCNRLSEMQMLVGGGQAFNKATKQAMASASFGIAKSLKSLNALH